MRRLLSSALLSSSLLLGLSYSWELTVYICQDKGDYDNCDELYDSNFKVAFWWGNKYIGYDYAHCCPDMYYNNEYTNGDAWATLYPTISDPRWTITKIKTGSGVSSNSKLYAYCNGKEIEESSSGKLIDCEGGWDPNKKYEGIVDGAVVPYPNPQDYNFRLKIQKKNDDTSNVSVYVYVKKKEDIDLPSNINKILSGYVISLANAINLATADWTADTVNIGFIKQKDSGYWDVDGGTVSNRGNNAKTIIVDGHDIEEYDNGTLTQLSNDTNSGYIGFMNEYLYAEIPPKVPDVFDDYNNIGISFNDANHYVLVGTGNDTLPSFLAKKWIHDYGYDYKDSDIPEDEYHLWVIKKPNVNIDDFLRLELNSNQFVKFKNLAFEDGIELDSPADIENCFIGVRADGYRDCCGPYRALSIKFADSELKEPIYMKHNLIVFRANDDDNMGVEVCAPVNSKSFENKLYIDDNYIFGYDWNPDTRSYAIKLCDRQGDTYADYQKNIYIEHNLIYHVPGGIYIGWNNREIRIKGNTIGVLTTTDKDELKNYLENWYDTAYKNANVQEKLPGLGDLPGIGIDISQGANRDIVIAFNYLFYGNRGIRIIDWSDKITKNDLNSDEVNSAIMQNIVVFRNFIANFFVNLDVEGLFKKTLISENISYRPLFNNEWIWVYKTDNFTSEVETENNMILGEKEAVKLLHALSYTTEVAATFQLMNVTINATKATEEKDLIDFSKNLDEDATIPTP